MADAIYHMTPADIEALSAGASDPNKFFDHFFRKAGAERAWNLDYNFTEKGKWQVEVCMALQTFIVVIGGIGTGKSLGVVMSAAFFAVLLKGFKFMNVAKESWQSQLMYSLLLEQSEDTLFQKLITASPMRPYPKVVIEFYLGEVHHKATLEFLSLGEEGDATNIFSWRGDWINVEEAGRIPNLATIVQNLSTRLTGNTADGRPFVGRMSLISNPWVNPELWQMFDLALANKEEGLAINLDTEDNKNVTEKQRKNSLALIPEDQQKRFMTGQRPENTGTYFSAETIEKGKNQLLHEMAVKAFNQKTPGYDIRVDPHLGIWYYQTPLQIGRIYYQMGDPGTGRAPFRNAPTIMVFDVTEATRMAPLVAMWWGNGGGSIYPFINKMYEWIDHYNPLVAGMDSTATQKFMAEILNVEHYGKHVLNRITPMDFSGAKKDAYLVALRVTLEASILQWPLGIVGINSQLGSYDREEDRGNTAKLAQDLVATMAMVAFAIRAHFRKLGQENGSNGSGDDTEQQEDTGEHRQSNDERRSSERR